MKTNLKLNFDKIPLEWAGYPVYYKVLDQSLDRIADGSLELISRGEKNLQISSDQLSAGDFLFTLKLPSGVVLSTPFKISEGQVTELHVPYERSPQEWLRSQTLLGHGLSRNVEKVARENFEAKEELGLNNPPPITARIFSAQFAKESILLHKIDLPCRVLYNDLHCVFEFDEKNYNAPIVLELQVAESFAVIILPPKSRQLEEIGEKISVDCAWTSKIKSVRDLSISVNMQNRRAQALLSYMKLGDAESVEKVSESVVVDAKKMFEEKMQDAGAACVAAYFLINFSMWDQLPAQWCQNISDFFPNLADGAIVNAHRKIIDLPEHYSDAHLDEIAEKLMLATARGLPVFSAGLRLLNDDLFSLLSTIEKKENNDIRMKTIKSIYKRMESYVQVCDFGNSFTTFIFDSKKQEKRLFTHDN